MAEDYGDKTEAPTPRRRAEAREQGNVARSPDLTAALLLLATMLMLSFLGPRLVAALKALVAAMLGPGSFSDLSAAGTVRTGLHAFLLVAAAIAPLLLGIALVALLANLLQVGLRLRPARLVPEIGALSPLKGFGKMFRGGRGPMRLLLGVLKIVLLAWVAFSAVHARIASIVAVQHLTSMQIFFLGAGVVHAIGIRIGLALLLLAIIDYAWQRFRIERELRMTRQEVKEELRRMEGDPRIKQRRRQIALQAVTQRLKNDVPTADVVITDPDQFAIALRYDANAMQAPRVIAKGRGIQAQRIREIAIATGVPIVERASCARSLFKLTDAGQEIPESFYAGVAEILTYVFELRGTLTQHRRAG